MMVNGVLYASNAVGLVEAFDPGTGKTLWVQQPGPEGLAGTSNRGVAYWGEGRRGAGHHASQPAALRAQPEDR